MAARTRSSLVIYDLDGTLLDSETTVSLIDSECLTAVGLDVSTREVHTRMSGLSSTDKFNAACALKGIPADAETLKTYKTTRAAAIENIYDRPGIAVHSGVFTTLRTLRDRGTSICVASNNKKERAAYALSKFGLAGYFRDCVFTSDMVERPKPAPDLFLLAARNMQFTPDQSCVVGDTLTDATGASAAGMRCAIFTGGVHDGDRERKLKSAGATLILPSHKHLLLHMDALFPQP